MISSVVLAVLAAGVWQAAPSKTIETLTPSPRFERLTKEDGLPSLRTRAITQDRSGFVWLGTSDGLARYDGYAFKVFRADAAAGEHTLSGSSIEALYDDGIGSLWIGTQENGLNRYEHDTQRFTHFRHDPQSSESLSSDGVRSLFETEEGLWIGTVKGLNLIDKETETFTRFRHDEVDKLSLIGNRVYSIHSSKTGELWVGTDKGLGRLDIAKKTFTYYRHDPENPKSLSSNTVKAVYQDKRGIVWAGTAGKGLNRLNPKTGRIRHYRHSPKRSLSLSNDDVTVIYEDRDGRLWVGTEGQLNHFDRQKKRFTRYISDSNDWTTVSNPRIQSIFQDQGGVLWVGTWQGTSKLDVTQMKNKLYRSGSTWSFDEDANGNIWIGEAITGLAKLDRRRNTITRYKPSATESIRVLSVHVDTRGYVWAGTQGAGLRRFDPKSETFTLYPAAPDEPGRLNSDVILDIHEDKDGTLWLGTGSGGLVKFDPKEDWFTYYLHDRFDPEGLGSNTVVTIHQDAKDDAILWLGTGTGGLNKLDKRSEKFEKFKHDPKNPETLGHDHVLTIHEKDGVLWIGTYGGGLNRFEKQTGKVERYTTKTTNGGLAHDFVFGILEDEAGALWISTNNGLNKLDPHAMTFSQYDAQDGLQGYEFTQGAYMKSDRTKELFFGGALGFNAFDPEDMTPDPFVPPVVITSFQISDEVQNFGKPIRQVDRVELGYDQPLFALEFSALSYAGTTRNRYRYKLEGLHDWSETTRRFVSYSSLAPGDYVFQVKGSNRHGTWNEEGASLAIHVEPPPWRTWWAYGLYLLILAGIVFAYVRYNEQRVGRLRQAARLQTVEKDLELASAVQSWFLPEESVVVADRFKLSGFFRPADQCSGDWWWYERLPNGNYWIVVGDVTGHGAGPAVLTAAVATALRIQRSAADRTTEQTEFLVGDLTAGGLSLTVPDRLEDVSSEIQDVCAGKYHMTMSSVVIDERTGRIRFYGTGGLPLLVLRPEGKVKSIGAPGTPLGVSPFKLGEVEYQAQPGERVLIMTDGIPETVTANGRMFGMRRCQELLTRTRGMSIEDATAMITTEVDAVRSGPQDDDMTYVLIDWKE